MALRTALRTSSVAMLLGALSCTTLTYAANDDITWTGLGDGSTFSDGNNWDLGGAPLGPVFSEADDSLKFNSAGATITNDLDPATNGDTPLQLGPGTGDEATSAAFHFQAGSGNFTITGFPVIAGSSGSDGVFRADAGAGMLQTFDLDITLAGGNRRRKVVLGNSGTVVFNGNINFTNSVMFVDEAAGRIELNGDNTGVGPGHVSAGANASRNAVRVQNAASNTVLHLGSDTAMGDVGSGSWDDGTLQMRGLNAVGITSIETDAPRDLSGYMFATSSGSGGGGVRFDTPHDISVGYLMRTGNGTRVFSNTNSGVVTVEGGIFATSGDAAQNLALFAGGTSGNVPGGNGQIVVNGRLFTTMIDPGSGGIVTPMNAVENNGTDVLTQVNGNINIRFGTVTLNGDSSSSWVGGQVTASNGSTLILGHDNALGDSSSLLAIQGDSTLDLNGHTLVQRFNTTNNGLGGNGVGGQGAIINSNTSTPAEVATEIVDVANFSVGGAGDLTLNNVRRTNGVTRNLTKVGAGTLTLGGDLDNSRYGLTVNEGTVLLNKDDGTGVAAEATSRFTVNINSGSSVVIANDAESSLGSGINNQIGDIMLVDVADGTLDLGGNYEGIGRLSGTSAGIIESSFGTGPLHGHTDAALIIGASPSASGETAGETSTGTWTWGGTIQDGSGGHPVSIALTGGVRQIFSGTNTYTGETGVLSDVVANNSSITNLEVSGSITQTSKVTVDNGTILSGTGSISSPNWDIHGTIQPGGESPTATDMLTLDFSAADGVTEFLLLQSDSTASFMLDTGLASSKFSVLGSASSSVSFDNSTFDFTDLTAGSLTLGDYTLFDGDVNTSYTGLESVSLTGLSGYSGVLSEVGNDVVLTLAAAADLDGDYNDDGVVNLADYTVWRNNLGAPDGTLPNDGGLMSTIGSDHYDLWKSNFGVSGAASIAASASAQIPEPSTMLLLIAASAAAVCCRRSK